MFYFQRHILSNSTSNLTMYIIPEENTHVQYAYAVVAIFRYVSLYVWANGDHHIPYPVYMTPCSKLKNVTYGFKIIGAHLRLKKNS